MFPQGRRDGHDCFLYDRWSLELPVHMSSQEPIARGHIHRKLLKQLARFSRIHKGMRTNVYLDTAPVERVCQTVVLVWIVGQLFHKVVSHAASLSMISMRDGQWK